MSVSATGGMARATKLLGLPLAFGGRVAAGWGSRLVGGDPEAVTAAVAARNAEHLFAVLGQLKGGAMKVGQALSVFDAMMPEEIAGPYHQALSRLQSSAPGMPARTVHRMLAEQLGRGWRRRFRDFDDVSAAAASLGQVHRAVWGDGRAVAVKVQYPGADLALDADLRTLERFSRLFALVVPGLDARAVIHELRDRMLDELDYRAEADRQRVFAAAFAGSDRLVVPRVVAAAPKVLVSDWVEGATLGASIGRPAADPADQARRDHHAHTVVDTLFSSPARVGLLHADPHPGNFLTLPDGRLAMVDYGSVAVLPEGIPPVLVHLLRHVADGEPAPMMRLLRAEGFVTGDVAPEDVLAYLGAVGDPLRVERFHFDRAWTRGQGTRVVRDRAYWRTGRALALPPRHLLVVRVLSGWMNLLVRLDCTVAGREHLGPTCAGPGRPAVLTVAGRPLRSAGVRGGGRADRRRGRGARRRALPGRGEPRRHSRGPPGLPRRRLSPLRVSLEGVDVAARPLLAFDDSFVRELTGLYQPWRAAPAPAPRLLLLNEELAAELGVAPDALRTPEGMAVLTGHPTPTGATPVAQAYAGHQFGFFQPRLGDGRALLLGEVLDVHGRRRDLHLKGSGRTPFARGGDGKAAVGPMLREYVISEAMHALGIPTTRALAVTATGEDVVRETMLPGAVLARVAASHLRVGSFEYAATQHAATQQDPTLVRRLADHAIARHHPDARDADNPYLALFDRVVDAQASLVARWMLVGFVHGVMNTDNMTISGETIDYGPCAFMEAFDPATVFSSIDETGRYAYGNQPRIAYWNLARLAETLLGLIDADQDAAVAAAVEVLQSFPDRYSGYWGVGMHAKLGLTDGGPDDGRLVDDLLTLLRDQGVDYTTFFRALSAAVRGDVDPARSLFGEPAAFDAWAQRWQARLSSEPGPTAAAMDRVNPVYVPRNQRVEEALTAATAGDLGPVRRLLDVLTRPFDERPGLEAYATPAPAGCGVYRTFCGT